MPRVAPFSPRIAVLLLTSLGLACSGGEGETQASATAATTSSTTDGDSDTDANTDSDTGVAAGPTWHQDVAPLVAEKCTSCHHPDGISPFSLTSYAAAKDWATLLADSVEDGSMPPFLAAETDECQPRYGWKDDLRLSDDDKALLRAWADAGAPEGDPNAAAPLPEPPSLDLVDADERLTIPSGVTIDGKSDSFICYSIDPGYDLDTWVNGLQINAGNSKIVHHVLIYVDEEAKSADVADENGQYECFGGAGINGNITLIGAWAPGMAAMVTPPDTAYRIPAGARLVMNVHYHPTGAGPEVDDSTSIDLRYHPSLPSYVALLGLVGNESGPRSGGYGLQPGPGDDGGVQFRIPAGADDHSESMKVRLDNLPDLRIWAAGTHMHYVGTDMLVKLVHNNPVGDEPDEECLVQTPNWDFGWQRAYAYDAPLDEVPQLRSGDELHMRCDYNNSMSNPFVVQALAEQGLDAPVDVHLGEETLDEMCLGVFGIAIKLTDLL
ncbi:MAG: hypothetical protein KC486_07415 [Myxococcales bacterium]|nr:hypothetical protein [Myxococcales bacterium]